MRLKQFHGLVRVAMFALARYTGPGERRVDDALQHVAAGHMPAGLVVPFEYEPLPPLSAYQASSTAAAGGVRSIVRDSPL
jgi:hypothetical protein